MANKTRAQARAERMAELEAEHQSLQAEEEESEKQVKAAAKVAGHARARVVEQLYELFRIVPVTKTRRNSDGTETAVQVDKDEEQRSDLLMRAIEAKVTECEELQTQLASHQAALASGDEGPRNRPVDLVSPEREQRHAGASLGGSTNWQ